MMSFAFRLAFSLVVLCIVLDFGEALALLLSLQLPLVLAALACLLVTYPTVQRKMLLAAN